MPFKSGRQRRFLWARKPRVAKKFAEEEKRSGKSGGSRRGRKSSAKVRAGRKGGKASGRSRGSGKKR